jgi:hypothetical protein
MSGFIKKPGSSFDNTDTIEPSAVALADRAEERLRECLKEGYDREPTEDEVEWVRAFPRRMAGGRPPEDPRIPTVTEMRRKFGWGPSEKVKEKYNFEFDNFRWRRR